MSYILLTLQHKEIKYHDKAISYEIYILFFRGWILTPNAVCIPRMDFIGTIFYAASFQTADFFENCRYYHSSS